MGSIYGCGPIDDIDLVTTDHPARQDLVTASQRELIKQNPHDAIFEKLDALRKETATKKAEAEALKKASTIENEKIRFLECFFDCIETQFDIERPHVGTFSKDELIKLDAFLTELARIRNPLSNLLFLVLVPFVVPVGLGTFFWVTIDHGLGMLMAFMCFFISLIAMSIYGDAKSAKKYFLNPTNYWSLRKKLLARGVSIEDLLETVAAREAPALSDSTMLTASRVEVPELAESKNNEELPEFPKNTLK